MDIRATSSNADINAVLQQMRQIRDQSKQIDHLSPAALDRANPTKDTSRADFGGALKGAIDTVNQLQQTSSASQTAFAIGAE
ncbi:MAG: flagellar hook-basal body complex protein FliE, partial [Pseudomonadales bacterium]|nr:flagellar hook-basal body complex protein FliE [Pseudomonadales bacterium]